MNTPSSNRPSQSQNFGAVGASVLELLNMELQNAAPPRQCIILNGFCINWPTRFQKIQLKSGDAEQFILLLFCLMSNRTGGSVWDTNELCLVSDFAFYSLLLIFGHPSSQFSIFLKSLKNLLQNLHLVDDYYYRRPNPPWRNLLKESLIKVIERMQQDESERRKVLSLERQGREWMAILHQNSKELITSKQRSIVGPAVRGETSERERIDSEESKAWEAVLNGVCRGIKRWESLGMKVEMLDGKAVVQMLSANSSAGYYGVMVKDVIKAIGNEHFANAGEMHDLFAQKAKSEKVIITVERCAPPSSSSVKNQEETSSSSEEQELVEIITKEISVVIPNSIKILARLRMSKENALESEHVVTADTVVTQQEAEDPTSQEETRGFLEEVYEIPTDEMDKIREAAKDVSENITPFFLDLFLARPETRADCVKLLNFLDLSGVNTVFFLQRDVSHLFLPQHYSKRANVFRDFFQCPPLPMMVSPVGSIRTIHLKTNIPAKSNIMYRFLVEGFNYGNNSVINSDVVGYTHSRWEKLGRTEEYGWPESWDDNMKNDYSPGVDLTQYYSNDGFVTLRLKADSMFCCGFSVSAWLVVHGYGSDHKISAVSYFQDADL